jgi:hypothetical protein
MKKTRKLSLRIAGNSVEIRNVNILHTVKSPLDVKGFNFINSMEYRELSRSW